MRIARTYRGRSPPLLLFLSLVLFPLVCGAITTPKFSAVKRETRYLEEEGGDNTYDDYTGASSVKETAEVKAVENKSMSESRDGLNGQEKPPGAARQSEEAITTKTELISKPGEIENDVNSQTKRDNVKAISDTPPVWPNDDDDDFVAKKNGVKESAASTDKSNNFDTEKFANADEIVEDRDTAARSEGEKSIQSAQNIEKDDPFVEDTIQRHDGDEDKSFNSNEDISIELGGASDLSTARDAENGTGVSEQHIATESTPDEYTENKNNSSAETNDKTHFGGAENDSSVLPEAEKSYNSFDEAYINSETETSLMEDTDTNSIGFPENAEDTVEFKSLSAPTSEIIAYHRNESDQEDNVMVDEDRDVAVQSGQDANMNGNVESKGKDTADTVLDENSTNKDLANSSTQSCELASNCRECIERSVEYLNSDSDPCYWVGQCISAVEAANMDNSPSGAYKCSDDGSPIYTGEQWNVALNAITHANNLPAEEREIPMGYYNGYDDDEDDFFGNVKFIFNVLLLSAVVATGLLIRKRVSNRLRDDPSLEMPDVVKEEVITLVLSIANFVKSKLNGSVGNTGTSDYRPITTNSRTESFEGQTVPLSTAADEEWGWGDEESGSNIELPATSADDNAEEEEELALAIAMSLSESTNGSTTSSMQPSASVGPSVKPNRPAYVAKKLKDKTSPRVASKPLATMRPTFQPSSSPPPVSQGDSIEDLLGQMSTSGGAVITSLGKDSKTVAVKAKPAPAKKDDTDDLFASMGFSNSYAAKSAVSAPKSAPLPSSQALAADNDDDADWGDDGDLDDLLDD